MQVSPHEFSAILTTEKARTSGDKGEGGAGVDNAGSVREDRRGCAESNRLIDAPEL